MANKFAIGTAWVGGFSDTSGGAAGDDPGVGDTILFDENSVDMNTGEARTVAVMRISPDLSLFAHKLTLADTLTVTGSVDASPGGIFDGAGDISAGTMNDYSAADWSAWTGSFHFPNGGTSCFYGGPTSYQTYGAPNVHLHVATKTWRIDQFWYVRNLEISAAGTLNGLAGGEPLHCQTFTQSAGTVAATVTTFVCNGLTTITGGTLNPVLKTTKLDFAGGALLNIGANTIAAGTVDGTAATCTATAGAAFVGGTVTACVFDNDVKHFWPVASSGNTNVTAISPYRHGRNRQYGRAG